jgi:hypothetical protein
MHNWSLTLKCQASPISFNIQFKVNSYFLDILRHSLSCIETIFFIVHNSTNIIHPRYVEYDLEKDLKYTTKELKELGLWVLHFHVWSLVWTSVLSFFFSCSLAGCFFFN